jgi:hypothetical protein
LTLTVLYLVVILYSSIIGLIKFRRLDLAFKLLTLLLMGTFVSETISTISMYVFRNNSLNGKIYLSFHIIAFGLIYYNLFDKPTIRKIILSITAVFFLSSIIINFIHAPRLLPSYMIMVQSLLLVGYSILYFFKLFQAPTEEEIISSSKLWFNSSVLIYFSSSFVIWASFYYLYLHKRVYLDLNLILTLLNIFHYSLFGISLHLYQIKTVEVVDGKSH